MGTRRLAFGLLPPVALVLLLVALAGLQYHWLGQVSEAERAQMRGLLERRVQALSEDFDRELAHAFLVFQTGLDALTPTDADALARRHDTWQTTARFPALIRAIYLVQASGDQRALFQYQPAWRTLEPADWPASLATLRDGLVRPLPFEAASDRALPGPRPMVINAGWLVLPEVPAVVVPLPDRSSDFTPVDAPRGPGNVGIALRTDSSSVILELDRAHIRDTVLPALAGRHFLAADRYELAILDSRGETVFRRGDADRPIDASTADARAPLFLLRFEATSTTRSATASPSNTTTARAATLQRGMSPGRETAPGMAVRLDDRVLGATAWQALIWHSAGSLDAAVAEARRRNLWLSFGILAVLAASAGLIVVNARRSERLAAQQMDFVATVSHELRTPLAVIRSAAQNLSAGVIHDPTRASRYGELIESEGRRLTDMVEHVLEYAGMSAPRRLSRAAPVDCGALAADVVAAHRPLIEAEGCTVTLDVAARLPPALADEEAVRRALQNLIANALKHGAGGRWIGVSVRSGETRGREEVRIAVSDRGAGIPAEDLTRIFEPFYRGRRAIERQIHGNGLGLSLVKRIAEAHGGRVAVRSSGASTTFTLHLPAAPAESAVAALGEPAAGGGGPR